MRHSPHHHNCPPGPPDGLEPEFEGVDPLSADVFRAFKRSMILNRHLMMSRFAPEDTHPAQAGCLLVLSQADGISQSVLADILHVSRPTVTTMLQRMEAAGTVERRTDESDQRVTRLFITTAGRELAARMRDVHAEIINDTFGCLSEDDRRELLRLLDSLNERAAAKLREAVEAE
ncbi:MAG: MarR family transcriptional regulator [Coriobacteriia bacterium]|nr:MarR family transcriptional regulator [Coriobacteriia bacterium]